MSTQDIEGNFPPILLSRPQYQLQSLSLKIRWEVTRRHPSYITNWTKRSFAYLGLSEEKERILDEKMEGIRELTLYGIGVSGVPVDPAIEFDQLDDETLDSAWLSGAVHPISLRGIVNLLINFLPKETLAPVCLAMMTASREDQEGAEPFKLQALRELQQIDHEALNSFPDEPFVSINPAASGRQTKEALNSLSKTWKEERGLEETRNRSKKHEEYLEIWNLREGWHKGMYDRTRENTFIKIAQERKKSIQTVHTQYKQAFELITGYEYSIDNWHEAFGLIKLTDLFGEFGDAGKSQSLTPKMTRDVPESVLRKNDDDLSVIELKEASDHSDVEITRCQDDIPTIIDNIRRRIENGMSNDDIYDDLDLKYPKLVEEIRVRGKELL